jgi:rare lipoprotein A
LLRSYSKERLDAARRVLGTLPAVATVALIGCTQLLPIAPATAPRAQLAPSAPTLAFQPLRSDALMAAALPVGAFEEPYTPPAPPAPAPEPEPQPAVAPVVEEEPVQQAASAPKEDPFESGIASTYGVGDGFQGNRTACGQIFNTHIVQVAHKTLKCGTVIRIEDAETGKSVVAEVTDRGPYIKGRIVDLSWAAFRELDPRGGLRPVHVYLVERD